MKFVRTFLAILLGLTFFGSIVVAGESPQREKSTNSNVGGVSGSNTLILSCSGTETRLCFRASEDVSPKTIQNVGASWVVQIDLDNNSVVLNGHNYGNAVITDDRINIKNEHMKQCYINRYTGELYAESNAHYSCWNEYRMKCSPGQKQF